MRVLDFRSDTVTKPSPEMRAAMASAEVGDDVLERDPTMEALELRVAEMIGTEAALWTPSGCMANLIALMLHLERGDRFLAPAQAHVLGAELGTPAWCALGMPEVLRWKLGPGKPFPKQIRKVAGKPGPYYALRTTLLCLENTHNFAGGTVIKVSEWRELVAAAKEAKLRVHLDGARIWHAAVAQGVSVRNLCEGADTVNVCLSKGLGAPMGSLLCSDRARIENARRLRKMLGGGVRQGGVVAAAGLVALESIPRLSEDHAKARRLWDGLQALGFQSSEPETNILFVPMADPSKAVEILGTSGVRVLPLGNAIRFITHMDLTASDVDEALLRIKPVATELLGMA